MKPENFLLDKNGHIKLTDFGLCTGKLNSAKVEKLKEKLEIAKSSKPKYYDSITKRKLFKQYKNEIRAFSMVGSPDYMAPEILFQEGYDHLVDYWGLGCLFFEMCAGYPPFTAETNEEVYANVYHHEETLERPVFDDDEEYCISDLGWKFVQRLLCCKEERFRTMKQISQCEYFIDVNFDQLHEMDPPIEPVLQGDTDVTYFDDFDDPDNMLAYKEVLEKQEKIQSQLKGNEKKVQFVGFTVKNK